MPVSSCRLITALLRMSSDEDKPVIPDLKKLIDGITYVLRLVFPKGIPGYVLITVGLVLLALLILLAIWGLFWVFTKIRQLWTCELRPLVYNSEEKRRSRRRRLFARYLSNEIFRLNSREEWADHRFAELEAAVEAEGVRVRGLFRFWSSWQTTNLRREKNLSRAIEHSDARLILVEGEPGAGKSVALRHVAFRMAEKARRSKRTNQVLPIYVNLKELRTSAALVNRDIIDALVRRSMNVINDRDVVEFIEDEFSRGIQSGTWFFLFDSFDEIPDVLGSIEPDSTIQAYSNAIADFLSGLNQCRGVIASRHFRGPKQFGWPRFRVLSLSERRQRQLIRRADLPGGAEGGLLAGLSSASTEIVEMSRNPMFLGLLCDYVRVRGSFPESVHTVFKTYTENRLTRDQNRLRKRFGLDPEQVGRMAENFAFCMAAEPGLGLSPVRDTLKKAMFRHSFAVNEDFDSALDALEFIKLARFEGSVPGEPRPFTFSHRRFQEYFATSVVLREPDRVSTGSLLTDGRWRETAVVLFQLQPLTALVELLNEARKQLANIVSDLDTSFLEYKSSAGSSRVFSWPQRGLHLLRILQEGFYSRPKELPQDIRELVGRILTPAFNNGDLISQKYALDVAGTAPESIFVAILRAAFQSQSNWLRDTAYRQVAFLKVVPEDIAQSIRLSIVRMAFVGTLTKERYFTEACLTRLSDAKGFLVVASTMRWLFRVDLSIHMVMCMLLLSIFRHNLTYSVIACIPPLTSYLLLRYHAIQPTLAHVSPQLGAFLDWRRTIFLRIYLFFSIPPMLAGAILLSKLPKRTFSVFAPDLLLLSHIELLPVILLITAIISTIPVLLLLWAPAVVSMAINGGLLPLRKVLLAPLIVVTRTLIRKASLLNGLFLLALMVLIAVPLLFINMYLGLVIGVVVGVSVISSMIYYGVIGTRLLVRDSIKWKRLDCHAQLSGASLVKQLFSFHTQLFRNRFIREVEKRNLLIVTEETLTALRRACHKIESMVPHDCDIRIDLPCEVKPTRFFFDPLRPYDGARTQTSSTLVDALYKIIEQLESARPASKQENIRARAQSTSVG